LGFLLVLFAFVGNKINRTSAKKEAKKNKRRNKAT